MRLLSFPALDTGILSSVDAWKHRFSFKCLSAVHEQVFGAKVPRYHAVNELDKKVRDYYVPPSLRVPGFGGSSLEGPNAQVSVQLTMQRCTAFCIREICALSALRFLPCRPF